MYVLTIAVVFALDALHVSLWKLGVRSCRGCGVLGAGIRGDA